jgi:hypothetical protein
MRLLLDAHVSGRVIARRLRERGHDVRAANEEPQLDAWEDDALLELATAERRIMVTFNVKDFPRICVDWAGAAKHHAGCLIRVGIDHGELGTILRIIEAAFAARPAPADWRDYAAWGTRQSAAE